MSTAALLDGPELRHGAESYDAHVQRLGPLPPTDTGLIDALQSSELRGRGGGAFPVTDKWRSVMATQQRPVVLVNGCESDPLSRKDRTLMATRPHLVIDGAMLAAQALGANSVIYYIASQHATALQPLRAALRERPRDDTRATTVVAAPARYVAGEESAAVHYLNAGIALPTTVPPRPYQRGVGGRPTLVQNVETLAHIALIARGSPAGTSLLTIGGDSQESTVLELPTSCTVHAALESPRVERRVQAAVLSGGLSGTWLTAAQAQTRPVDGVIHLLPAGECGVAATARAISYLADESSQQCGPCAFGLLGIATTLQRIVAFTADGRDLDRLRHWTTLLPGRGACHLPDGAATHLRSALTVFAEDFEAHIAHRRCEQLPLAVPA